MGGIGGELDEEVGGAGMGGVGGAKRVGEGRVRVSLFCNHELSRRSHGLLQIDSGDYLTRSKASTSMLGEVGGKKNFFG